jgi:hypothetical protein
MNSSGNSASSVHRLPVAMLLAAILSAAAASPARAALGGDSSSVEADRVSMKGEARVTAVSGYEVREITVPGGTLVREYLTPAGKVFAVSWRGPYMPNLRQLLGSYFARYTQAGRSAPHTGHRHFAVQEPDLVVQSNGRTRAFYGRAWDPTLLPPNFSAADIG